MNEQFELVIFGANGLIGKSLCNYFLNKNLNVIAADMRFSNLQDLKKDFEGKLLLLQTDATCINSVDNVFKENTNCKKNHESMLS